MPCRYAGDGQPQRVIGALPHIVDKWHTALQNANWLTNALFCPYHDNVFTAIDGYRSMTKTPSEIHSCLTDERIDFIGQLIARVRAENLDAVEDRDNGWCIGCRAHAWICSEILSQSESIPWLSIVDPSLRFIAKIGSVEFSFYKGMAEKPKSNIYSRAQSHPELRQSSMLFDDLPIPEKLVWVYAVETDLEGTTTNIEFFGMSESGEVVASRTVPIFHTPTNLVAINTTESEPVDLPPASASLPRTRKDKASDSEEHNE